MRAACSASRGRVIGTPAGQVAGGEHLLDACTGAGDEAQALKRPMMPGASLKARIASTSSGSMAPASVTIVSSGASLRSASTCSLR